MNIPHIEFNFYNMMYADYAADFCRIANVSKCINIFIKFCQRGDSFFQTINPSIQVRYKNIAIAATFALTERVAISLLNAEKDFDLKFFHPYFWTRVLQHYAENFDEHDFNHGIEFLEIASTNFSVLPAFLNFTPQNCLFITELLGIRIREMCRKSGRSYSLPNGVCSFAEFAYEQIKKISVRNPTYNESDFNYYKKDFVFIDQHLTSLINVVHDINESENGSIFCSTYYHPIHRNLERNWGNKE